MFVSLAKLNKSRVRHFHGPACQSQGEVCRHFPTDISYILPHDALTFMVLFGL